MLRGVWPRLCHCVCSTPTQSSGPLFGCNPKQGPDTNREEQNEVSPQAYNPSDEELDAAATAYVYGELADTITEPDAITELVDWQLRQGLSRRYA